MSLVVKASVVAIAPSTPSLFTGKTNTLYEVFWVNPETLTDPVNASALSIIICFA